MVSGIAAKFIPFVKILTAASERTFLEVLFFDRHYRRKQNVRSKLLVLCPKIVMGIYCCYSGGAAHSLKRLEKWGSRVFFSQSRSVTFSYNAGIFVLEIICEAVPIRQYSIRYLLFSFPKVVNQKGSFAFQKTVAITFPAEGIVFAFFIADLLFFVRYFDCCLFSCL